MSVAKVIEVLAEGPTVEGAVEDAVAQVARSVHSVRNVYVQDVQAIVEDNRVAKYRVDAKVTFVVDEERAA